MAAPLLGMSEDSEVEDAGVTPGDVVYDEDGEAVGVVTGYIDQGVEVTPTSDPDEVRPEEYPGQDFGEGELMWRCDECGEMGDLEGGMPEECPNCGAPKEGIYYWTED